MPTTANLNSYSRRHPVPVGSGTKAFVIKATTSTSAMAVNDVNKIAKIEAKGVTVVDAYLQCADCDTHATPTAVVSVQITNGTTTKTIIHQSSAPQAGGLTRPSKITSTEDGIGFTTDDDNYYIQLVWTTAAATPAAVAFNVMLVLDGYYLEGAVTE